MRLIVLKRRKIQIALAGAYEARNSAVVHLRANDLDATLRWILYAKECLNEAEKLVRAAISFRDATKELEG
jgi:hypothetical protein